MVNRSRSKSRSPVKRSPKRSRSKEMCFCLHCQKKVKMMRPSSNLTKNNRNIMCGRCKNCNNKVCKFI